MEDTEALRSRTINMDPPPGPSVGGGVRLFITVFFIIVFHVQDTVVALQALSTFASHGGAITNNLNLEVLREDGERVAVFFIHQDNYLLLQSDQVHTNTALLSVTPVILYLCVFRI